MSKKMKYCSSCEKTKEVNEFYKNQSNCKECQREQIKQSQDNRRNKTILVLVEHGIIEKDYIEAAKLLFDSCASRVNNCNKNSGYYHDNNIRCEWDSIEQFFIDCFEIDGFWKVWKEQYLIFKETGETNDRPTIDRINENGNYTKDNIQVLSHLENVRKAQLKPCKAVIIKDKDLNNAKLIKFESKTDFYNKLSILLSNIPNKKIKEIPFDSGLVHEIDDTYSIILQSQDIDKNKIGKDITEPSYRMEFGTINRFLIDPAHGTVTKIAEINIPIPSVLVNKLII